MATDRCSVGRSPSGSAAISICFININNNKFLININNINLIKKSLNGSCRIYRSVCLAQTKFIAVTGSCGKTTTKELIAAVLSTRFRVQKNPVTCNTPYHVVRTVLLTRPWHDACVLEVAAAADTRWPLELPLGLIKPDIGVVTNIGMDHIDLFGNIEAIAEEKGKLVAALPPDGTAVLNADDHRVLEMRNRCPCRVVTYGTSQAAMLRAEGVSGDWPDRLSFTAICDGQSARVETQLCGAHWVPNVLAAIAVGQAAGMSLNSAAEAIRHAAPVTGRMSPVTIRGVTFIRDDWKASYSTVPASLEFMRRATARRKFIILGTLSDYQGHADLKYVDVAKRALGAVDIVLFVGRWASRCLRAKRHPEDHALRAFATLDQLSVFLRDFLEPGDLVMLKGSANADQLDRVVSAWRDPQRPRELSQHEAAYRPRSAEEPGEIATTPVNDGAGPVFAYTVIGLGNPGEQYQHTPHNVGQQALDELAARLQAKWSLEDDALVARVEVDGQHILLAKPRTLMNDVGPALRRLAARRGLAPERCIVIHDDIDLALGVVRQREKGSAGGHKGMQSILIAFQSEGFRRIKIGVGRPTHGTTIPEYVLRPFDQAQQGEIDRACIGAANWALEMIRRAARTDAPRMQRNESTDERGEPPARALLGTDPGGRPPGG